MSSLAKLLITGAFALSPLASSEAAVKAFMPNRGVIAIAEAPLPFPSNGRGLVPAQLDALASYVNERAVELEAEGPLNLKPVSQSAVGPNLYVRFQQVITFNVGSREHTIPLEGASIVVRIADSKVVSLNSSLVSPSRLGVGTAHRGFSFGLSDAELAKFIGLLKTSEPSREAAKSFFAGIARRSNQKFDFDSFLNREVAEQRDLMDRFFGSLGSIGTTRLLLEMAAKNRVAFVRYGDKWLLQLSGLFELPIQFDVAATSKETDPLVIRNLRELRTRATEVRGFESPHFPGGKKLEGGEHANHAAGRLKQVSEYFAQRFGWTSFKGKGIDAQIEVHTQLKSIDHRENASWIGGMQKFIVGEGGTHLFGLDDSLSVLGHEYSHAIIQFSSALAYRGQSGALNEHFADIQGATIDATINNGGQFKFTIGEDVLTPGVKAEKAKLLELIMQTRKYLPEDVSRYGLRQIGLRHLFAPLLSFATQFDSLEELRKAYPDDCQPSLDNDNCGVHTASGIPNKAASLIIGTLGLEETRSLFFNTMVYRLNQNSNFQDYLVQLVEECRETPALASKCDVIVSSFAMVGVTYPRPGERTGTSDTTRTTTPTTATLVPVVRSAATPILNLCGWVDRANADRIRIFDDRYNATIVKRNYEVKTRGDFAALDTTDCACVSGRLTQTTNARGEMINAFLDVVKIEDRGNVCATHPALKDKRPTLEPDHVDAQLDPSKPHFFCGWVSVSSKSRNVTIIDNKYDVALIASGYPNLTRGDFSEIYKNQCACAYGRIAQTQNSKGTTFNYLSSVEGKRVVYKKPEACVGIEWK